MTRILATTLMGFDHDRDGPVLWTSQQRAERAYCAASFLYFLNYWRFRNRETGETSGFHELWEGRGPGV